MTLKKANFHNNSMDGVFIYTYDGDITIDDIIAANNGQEYNQGDTGSIFDGIYAVTDYGNITLKNALLKNNMFGSGAYLVAASNDSATKFYIYNVKAFWNGWITGFDDDDGIRLNVGDFSTVTVKNSSLMSNSGSGLDIERTPVSLYISGTTYYGNGGNNIEIAGAPYYP